MSRTCSSVASRISFSYLVLNHMPNKELALPSIQEMLHILSPGGAFVFQFICIPVQRIRRAEYESEGQGVSAVLDRMTSSDLRRSAGNMARLAGIDAGMVGNTWRGVALSVREIQDVLRTGSAISAEFVEPLTPMAWCYGCKQR